MQTHNNSATLKIMFFIAISIFLTACSLNLPILKQNSFPINKTIKTAAIKTIEPIALQIDFGDDRIITNYQLLITNYENHYLWPVMKEALEKNKVYLDFQDYGGDLGVFIKQIGDKKNGQDGKYWQYLVNGEYAKVGVSNYKIKPKDVILWKFTSNYEL